MKDLSVIILTGGEETRMGSLCTDRPKPCLPFGGHYRVIDFCLSNCLNSGVKQIDVMVDYQRESLVDYLGLWQATNPQAPGLNILVPKTGSYSGAADAVYQHLDYLAAGGESVLILAADHIYKMDYRPMLEFHQKTGADVTIAVTPVPLERASRFGILVAGPSGRITSFEEKPEIPQTNLASMSIYIFKRSKLIQKLSEDAKVPDSDHDFGHSILPGMVTLDKAFAYYFKGYWRDISTVKAYYDANIEISGNPTYLSYQDNWPIFTFSRYEPLPVEALRDQVRRR